MAKPKPIAKSWKIYWAFRSGDYYFSIEFLIKLGTADPKTELENATGWYIETLLYT